MKMKDSTTYPFAGLRLVTICAWTAVAIGCLIADRRENDELLSSNALTMAKASFDKDLLFRRWATLHGGVYVPVTAQTPANPYLKHAERDIVTPSGRRLTLMNPAYMTRQIHELSRTSGNAPLGHITSLKPLRPENAPDPWEAKALASFQQGVPEAGEFVGSYYRYMRPLTVEKPCLSCHAVQGYREGDLRGGISVSVPVAELLGALAHERAAHQVIIVAVWLTGLAGIWFGLRKIGDATVALVVERNNLVSLFDAAPVSMLLIDDRREVVRVNRAMERSFGGDFDGIKDRRCGAVLGCARALCSVNGCGAEPECPSCPLNHAITRATQQGEPSTGEAAVVTAGPQGRSFWVNFGVAPLLLDGRRFVMLSLVDITYRKESEDALRQSELRYRLLVESVPAMLFKIGPDGRFQFHDDKIEQLCGYAKEEFDTGSMNWLDLVHEADRDKVSQALRDAAQPGGESSLEFRVTTGAGKPAWLLARARCTPDSRGGHSDVIGVLIDVTEQKQLEERYLHSQKLEAVGRLAGGVAHDFNNLLTVIMGHADILAHSCGDVGVVRVAASRIVSAAEKAATLTRQLLTFSRKQIFAPVVLNLSQVVAGLEPMLRPLIKEDIGVITASSPSPCLVLADKGQMEQVLVNLVVNACDAMPLGGTLNITTSTIDLDQSLCLRLGKELAPGSYVLLSVSDTGVGMDRETIGHIFDPFFTTKEVGKGTGLGLSTVHGIVKQSGGDIRVYSTPGQGTTFRIYLPLFSGSGVRHAPPSESCAAAGKLDVLAA